MKPLIESTTGWITGTGRGQIGEQFAGRDELGLGLAVGQRDRRLQRGVKAVFAGILRQVAPVRRQPVRKGQVVAAIGIVAEQRAPNRSSALPCAAV